MPAAVLIMSSQGIRSPQSTLLCPCLQARETYEKALEIEPDDKGLQEARHRAHVAEHKAMEVHKHKFKRRHLDSDQRQNPNESKKRPQAAVAGSAIAAAGMSNKSKLSFDEDDDESEDA